MSTSKSITERKKNQRNYSPENSSIDSDIDNPKYSKSRKRKRVSDATTNLPGKSRKGRVVKESLDDANLADDIPKRAVEKYEYLAGNFHRDNQVHLVYKVIKVYRHRGTGYITADGDLILNDDSTHQIPDHRLTHVGDIVRLTKDYKEETSGISRAFMLHFVADDVVEAMASIYDAGRDHKPEMLESKETLICSAILFIVTQIIMSNMIK
jgi:hypothetical protein